MTTDNQLSDWRQRATEFERQINGVLVGQQGPIRYITLAVFARGHVLLEGSVGVGKTTMLRTVARAIGGAYERIEGTIDLMPSDLIYYTYLNEEGKPRVDPGPILKHGAQLSTFFFNEINRARPQVHSLLLRVMAERSVTAFNREVSFPCLQVFADRNLIEKEETFELPAAARDRFLMEVSIEHPDDSSVVDDLMFNPRYHNADALIESVRPEVIPYRELDGIAELLQQEIHASPSLRRYAQDLWRATHRPQDFGGVIDGVDMDRLILSGASPRGMSFMIRAARVQAWLHERDAILPEDLQSVFYVTMAHRIFLNPVYEFRRAELIPQLMNKIIHTIAAP